MSIFPIFTQDVAPFTDQDALLSESIWVSASDVPSEVRKALHDSAERFDKIIVSARIAG